MLMGQNLLREHLNLKFTILADETIDRTVTSDGWMKGS